MSIVASIKMVLAPPHPAGTPFVIGGAVVAVAGLIFWAPLGLLAVAFVLFSLFFFRDPERVPPDRSDVILAAADGRVVAVKTAVPPVELGMGAEPRWRVSIFLSVLNVHVNRVPVSGVVTRLAYRKGAFVNAALDKASDDNERNAVAIKLQDGRDMAVVQIAGLIARRILCDVREGDAIRAGDRYGIIRFGSRTDLYLPHGTTPLVCEGQTMVGGETVIAALGSVNDIAHRDAATAAEPLYPTI